MPVELADFIDRVRTTPAGLSLIPTGFAQEYMVGPWKVMFHERGQWGCFDFNTGRLGHFRTLAEARWYVTRKFFRMICGTWTACADVNAIITGANAPGGWLPFRILADKLDDLGAAEEAAAVRRFIPKGA